MKNIFLTIITFLVIGGSYAQKIDNDVPETILFNQELDKYIRYQAKSLIQFKTNFHAVASTLHKWTLFEIVDHPNLGTVNYSGVEGLSNDDDMPMVSQSNHMGSLPGNVAVTPLGGAGYSIPIGLPTATGGLQPSLTISYSSDGGDGYLSQGWNLGGLSAVTRVGSNIYHDDINDGVDFDENDRFSLDGTRLLAAPESYGTDGCTYQTEVASFVTIVSHGDYAGGPEYFIVTAKDGTKFYYGQGDDSRYELPKADNAIAAPVLAWMLTKVEDNYGNYYTIEYYKSGLKLYPWRIKYTGNSNTGLEPQTQVNFHYITRQDVSSGYMYGYEIENNILLHDIVIKQGNMTISKYNIYYDHNPEHSYLTAIVKSNKDGETINPTYFRYKENYKHIGVYDMDLYDPNYRFGVKHMWLDANGDGKYDHLSYNSDAGDPTFLLGTRTIYRSPFSFIGEAGFGIGDINSDGIQDFVFVRGGYNEDNCIDMKISEVYGGGKDDDDVQWNLVTKDVPDEDNDCDYIIPYKCEIGDVDGDAKAELILYTIRGNDDNPSTNKSFTIYDWNGTNLSITTGYIYNNWLWYPHYIGLFDYNGDGIQEIGTIVTMSNGPSGIVPGILVTNGQGIPVDIKSFEVWTDEEIKVKFVDINCDGKSDIITNYGSLNEDSGDNIWLNTGDGFIEKHTNRYFFKDQYGSDVNCRLYDVNYDGFPDYIRQKSFPDRNYDVLIVSTFDPNTFGFYEYFSHNAEYEDGQGYVDDDLTVINRGDNIEVLLKPWRNSDPQLGYKVYRFRNNALAHKLTEVQNGNGLKETVEYDLLLNSENYSSTPISADSYPQYPLFTMAGPKSVAVTTTSELGDFSNSLHYTYKDAMYHAYGKGMLGFKEVAVTDDLSGKTKTTYRKIINNNFVLFDVYRIVTGNGYLLNTEDLSYTLSTVSSKSIDSYMITQTTQVSHQYLPYDVKSTSIKKYDTNGNLYEDEYKVSDAQNGDIKKKTVMSEFVQAGGTCLRLPKTVEVTRSIGEESEMYTFNKTYSSAGAILSETNLVGEPVQTTTTYTYDPYGNIASSVQTGGDHPLEKSYEYDFSGRYLLSETTNNRFIKTYDYDPVLGALITETDINGFQTRIDYNSWGEKTKVYLPDGNMVQYQNNWSSEKGAAYEVSEIPDGNPSNTTYFNALGQKIKSKVVGAAGNELFVYYKYDEKKRLWKESEPAIDEESAKYKEYGYDDYDRVKTVTLPNGNIITNIYSGYNTTTKDEGIVEKTISKGANGLVQIIESNTGKIEYTDYFASGKPAQITVNGVITNFEFDARGNRTKISGPGTGHKVDILSTYNGFNQLKTFTDAKRNNSYQYDEFGRLIQKTSTTEGTFTYHYDKPGAKGMLYKVTGPGFSKEFDFNELLQVKTKTVTIDDRTFVFHYTYDQYGNLQTETGPDNVTITYSYDQYSKLQEVYQGDNLIWRYVGENAIGQLTDYELGNCKTGKYQYDDEHRLELIEVSDVLKFRYGYTVNYTNNINIRRDDFNSHPVEQFGYTTRDELETVRQNFSASTDSKIEYDEDGLGNITSTKNQLNHYTYNTNNAGPYTLTKYSSDEPVGNSETLVTHFNAYNKIGEAIRGDFRQIFEYGPNRERRVSKLYKEGKLERTVYYLGNYELEVYDDMERSIHYISGAQGLVAASVQSDTANHTYYVHHDHLGSIVALTDETGEIVEQHSFGAWGRVRNSDHEYEENPQFLLRRGYTGQEHMPEFGLINMNGRVYDPLIRRFLSPDPQVGDPGNPLSYNRYAYAMNNPLKYTDPDGECPLLIAMGIGVAVNLIIAATQDDMDFGDFARAVTTGAAIGALGYGVGAAAGAIYSAAVIIEGAAAGVGGTISPVLNGIITQGTSMALVGGLTGMSNAMMTGGDIGEAFVRGAIIGGITGIITGGLTGYLSAPKGVNPWTGKSMSVSSPAPMSSEDIEALISRFENGNGTAGLDFGGDGEGPLYSYISGPGTVTCAPDMTFVFSKNYHTFNPLAYIGITSSNFIMEMHRVEQTKNSTLSKFYATGPIPLRPVEGYILEPSGPQTTLRNMDKRIPDGIYNVDHHVGKTYTDNYILSNNSVPKNRGILIHKGNYHRNTIGCLLPGGSYSKVAGDYVVWNSGFKMNELRNLFGTNSFVLNIYY